MTEITWYRATDQWIVKTNTYDHVQLEQARDAIKRFREGDKILVLPKDVKMTVVQEQPEELKPIEPWVSFLERFKNILEITPLNAEPGKFMLYGHGQAKVEENDLLILAQDCRRLVNESSKSWTNAK